MSIPAPLTAHIQVNKQTRETQGTPTQAKENRKKSTPIQSNRKLPCFPMHAARTLRSLAHSTTIIITAHLDYPIPSMPQNPTNQPHLYSRERNKTQSIHVAPNPQVLLISILLLTLPPGVSGTFTLPAALRSSSSLSSSS